MANAEPCSESASMRLTIYGLGAGRARVRQPRSPLAGGSWPARRSVSPPLLQHGAEVSGSVSPSVYTRSVSGCLTVPSIRTVPSKGCEWYEQRYRVRLTKSHRNRTGYMRPKCRPPPLQGVSHDPHSNLIWQGAAAASSCGFVIRNFTCILPTHQHARGRGLT